MPIFRGTIENELINNLYPDINGDFPGTDGNDEIDGGAGADTMNGGAGNDSYKVDNLGDVVIDIDATTPSSSSMTGISTTVNFNLGSVGTNKLSLSLRANGITGTGSSGNDLIISYANNTTLIGGDGHDVLKGARGSNVRGGNGNDVLEITNGNTGALRGGAGNDTYNVFSTSGSLVIDEYTDGGGGIDTIFSLVDFNLGSQPGVNFVGSNLIENLTLAVLDVTPGDKMGGPITGIGNSADNQIIGNRRDNILSGLSGNDTIYGSFGNDSIDGGFGNDSLYGEVGDDTLVGGAGADYMDGGVGDDTYFVDNAGDVVVEAIGGGTDTVFVTATWSTAAEVENINVTGNNAVNITLSNTVGTVIEIDSSNTRNNIFIGGSGNDTMNGKVSIDTLTGGAGADTFAFGGFGLTASGSGGTSIRQDIITDFSGSIMDGQGDKIQLDQNTFSAVVGPTLDAGKFVSGSFGAGNAGMDSQSARIVYNTFNGALFYNADGSAFGAGDGGGFFATLTGAPTLTAADFTIV